MCPTRAPGRAPGRRCGPNPSGRSCTGTSSQPDAVRAELQADLRTDHTDHTDLADLADRTRPEEAAQKSQGSHPRSSQSDAVQADLYVTYDAIIATSNTPHTPNTTKRPRVQTGLQEEVCPLPNARKVGRYLLRVTKKRGQEDGSDIEEPVSRYIPPTYSDPDAPPNNPFDGVQRFGMLGTKGREHFPNDDESDSTYADVPGSPLDAGRSQADDNGESHETLSKNSTDSSTPDDETSNREDDDDDDESDDDDDDDGKPPKSFIHRSEQNKKQLGSTASSGTGQQRLNCPANAYLEKQCPATFTDVDDARKHCTRYHFALPSVDPTCDCAIKMKD